MLKIIDLFAGIGGIRLGFEQAINDNNMDVKLKCVFTSEIEKYAVETYKANFNESNINGDITTIPSEDIPDHDILLAGFPCQPFSQAGKKLGFNETRGTLFFEIERILLDKKPKAFLLENVKHLKGHNKGNTFKVILKHLKEAGYNVFYKVITAKDFGVPQNRSRIFLVGFRNQNILYNFPEPLGVKTRVGDILEPKVDDKYTISDKMWIGHVNRKKKNKEKGYGFGYSIFNKDSEYTNTITYRYYKDGAEALIEQKGKNPRVLTPRECARLQGFSDSFKIPVSDNRAYRLFGNSVAVPVIKAIATNMLYYLGYSNNVISNQDKNQMHLDFK